MSNEECSGTGAHPQSEYAKLLDEVVEIDRVLVEPEIAPQEGSPAADELRRACDKPGTVGMWGEEPVRAAYALAIMNYRIALDHAAAIAALTADVHAAISASVVTRALVEVASQAWWLLDPGIGHNKRLQRMLALRYRSACEGEKTAIADGVPEKDLTSYTETKEQVARSAGDLGLAVPEADRSKPWTVYACGEERLPTASQRVKEMFSDIDVPSIYALFSGSSHGELFVMLREFEETARGNLGLHYRSVVNEESFKGAVAVASYALYPPAERLGKLFGLDSQQPNLR